MKNPEHLCPECHNAMVFTVIPALDEEGYLCTQCGHYWVRVTLDDIKDHYSRGEEE